MMAGDISAYSQDALNAEIASFISDRLASPRLRSVKQPRAVLLGGQSGAGKTALHALFRDRFARNVIIINGDEYRSRHPNFLEIQRRYGVDAPAYTAGWSGKMTEALIDELSRLGYNLVIEGTLRTSSVPLATARLLKGRGYGVSLALMAVKPEISLVSCQIRYEQMRIAGTTPRAVDPKHHDAIVHEIVGNLDVLEDSGLFDEISLYDRAKERLYPLDGEQRRASAALSEVLFGPWSDEERLHCETLKAQLGRLRSQ